MYSINTTLRIGLAEMNGRAKFALHEDTLDEGLYNEASLKSYVRMLDASDVSFRRMRDWRTFATQVFHSLMPKFSKWKPCEVMS